MSLTLTYENLPEPPPVTYPKSAFNVDVRVGELEKVKPTPPAPKPGGDPALKSASAIGTPTHNIRGKLTQNGVTKFTCPDGAPFDIAIDPDHLETLTYQNLTAGNYTMVSRLIRLSDSFQEAVVELEIVVV
jgi:hypothetical protein